MAIREADKLLIPDFEAYERGAEFFKGLALSRGGLEVYRSEVLRQLENQAYILTPNHRSFWDPFWLGVAMSDPSEWTKDAEEDTEAGPLQGRAVHMTAKAELWSRMYPGVGQRLDKWGAISLERGRGVGLDGDKEDHMAHVLNENAVLCVFPEGHRYRKHTESVHRDKIRSTIGFFALKYGATVMPVGIAGRVIVFGDPIYHDKVSVDDLEKLKPIKDAAVDRIHAGMDHRFRQARGLLPR